MSRKKRKSAASAAIHETAKAPSFKAEAHRQSRAAAKSRHAKADQDFIDAASGPGGIRDAE